MKIKNLTVLAVLPVLFLLLSCDDSVDASGT